MAASRTSPRRRAGRNSPRRPASRTSPNRAASPTSPNRAAGPTSPKERGPDGPAAPAADRLDPLAELDAILDLGRRAPGSDAERRTALHLKQRLDALGREAETESLAIYPGWPLAYALLAAAAVAASVLAVDVPVAGASLALAAALLTFLDAGALIPTLRRLLGRRASQNVVSWGGEDKPGDLLLVAHYDAGRGGLAHGDRTARRRAALSALVRRPIGGLQPLFWAELAVLACALLRLAGLDGTPLTAVQFVPTLGLIVAIALLLDIALAGTGGGENDNASGSVARPAPGRAVRRRRSSTSTCTCSSRAGRRPARPACAPSSRRHRDRLAQDRTVLVNVDRVGSGERALHAPRGRPAGAAVVTRSWSRSATRSPRTTTPSAPIVNRAASDASAAPRPASRPSRSPAATASTTPRDASTSRRSSAPRLSARS